MKCGVFLSWVISYANEWEGHSNNWGTTHSWSFDRALELSWCFWCVSICLQIEKQGLAEFDLSVILDPFDFNQFMLCPWAISFFQKLCPDPFVPVSCSFPEPRRGAQCCLYNLLEGQPENSWPLGGKYCIISNPSRYSGLRLPCLLQHVQQQHLSVNLLQQVTGTQCLLEVHLLVASPQG